MIVSGALGYLKSRLICQFSNSFVLKSMGPKFDTAFWFHLPRSHTPYCIGTKKYHFVTLSFKKNHNCSETGK